MIKIIISCHATSHLLTYGDDRAMAEAELSKIIPLLGRDRWGKNGKEENPTHTVLCPTGNVTIVLEKVEVARLVDSEVNDKLHHEQNDRAIERELDWRRKLAAENLLQVR